MKKTIVRVQFERYGEYQGNGYSYFTDLKLKKGDQVLVNGAGVLKVCKVVQTKDIQEHHAKYAEKWIIQKIDTDLIKQAKEKEK